MENCFAVRAAVDALRSLRPFSLHYFQLFHWRLRGGRTEARPRRPWCDGMALILRSLDVVLFLFFGAFVFRNLFPDRHRLLSQRPPLLLAVFQVPAMRRADALCARERRFFPQLMSFLFGLYDGTKRPSRSAQRAPGTAAFLRAVIL